MLGTASPYFWYLTSASKRIPLALLTRPRHTHHFADRRRTGGNPNFIVFDELWGYTSEGSRRLWDEMIPVPTRKVSARLTVTYAGFEGESELLEELYKRGLKGEQVA